MFACRTERNLCIFLYSYVSFVFASVLLFPLERGDLLWLLASGGIFISVELLNTSLERLADAVDDHCKSAHQSHCFVALKHTKDIAAAASLVSLVFTIMTFLIVLAPYVLLVRVLPS